MKVLKYVMSLGTYKCTKFQNCSTLKSEEKIDYKIISLHQERN